MIALAAWIAMVFYADARPARRRGPSSAHVMANPSVPARPLEERVGSAPVPARWPGKSAGSAAERALADFSLPSRPGAERQAMAMVAASVTDCGLSALQVQRLDTAVAEAVINAAEHGNRYRPGRTVDVRVSEYGDRVVVAVTDHGGGASDTGAAEMPDLAPQLAGVRSPRGWGLFLIRHMVDAFDVTISGSTHTVLLTMHLPSSRERELNRAGARAANYKPVGRHSWCGRGTAD
jgi:anti-sigma regulatory factor (Ser/Thr protein kinase)